MRLLSITLARITTVRFCVNDTGEAMRTSPYLPFAKSIVPLALSILRVTASTPRGKYWYNVDTPDLEPLHSILISRHPVWGWLSRWPASRGARTWSVSPADSGHGGLSWPMPERSAG